ncbi:MAG: Na+/H+ antiporter [Rhodospirillales bacterium]|nr:Na+/H+ antiporter [Rhodospirillales bacterium]
MTLVLGLLACAIALSLVARWFRVPYPIALVLGGLALGFMPDLPRVGIDPALTLSLILPPILYQAAIFTSWRDFRANWRPIAILAISLVLVTAAAVAVVVKLLIPGMPWAVAFVLGAIVSPSDAVAATAVMRHLNIPRRIITIIEGESLLNDAAGLVLYKFALVAVLTGMFSLPAAIGEFALVGLGGVALGAAAGWVSVQIQRVIADPPSEITLSLGLPFAVFLAAEEAHVSAVVAVVAAGLVRGWYSPQTFSAQTRIQAHTVWDIVVFLINIVVFILIGLELPRALDALTAQSPLTLVGWAAAVSATVIVVRFVWVFRATYLEGLVFRQIRREGRRPKLSSVVVVAWSGMRGVVSLVIALALPLNTQQGDPFPYRELVIFLSYAVILVTLVLQGLTLGPLIRLLRVGADSDERAEERVARTKTIHAAMVEIERRCALADGDIPHAVAKTIREDYAHRLRDVEVRYGDQESGATPGPLRDIRLSAIAAARRRLWKLRRDGEIGDEVMLRIQRELDLEEVRLG